MGTRSSAGDNPIVNWREMLGPTGFILKARQGGTGMMGWVRHGEPDKSTSVRMHRFRYGGRMRRTRQV